MRVISTESRRSNHGVAMIALIATASLLSATMSLAQAPPPRPEPRAEEQQEKTPPKRPPRPVSTGPPPPVLLVSSDMACRLELDGKPIGELEKDVVERFVVKEGDHLLQAFPLGVEGPTWKQSVKAPETGTVAQTIELVELVEEWNESQRDRDRFEVQDRVVIDHDTGLVWARNVGPEMKWSDVQSYCPGHSLDEVRGWRLPVLDELSTLQYEDHESPRQEMAVGDERWTILGKRREENEVLPRLIYPAFDHNAVGTLWIKGDLERTACSFLGGFSCEVQRKKKAQAAVLCVREHHERESSQEAATPTEGATNGG